MRILTEAELRCTLLPDDNVREYRVSDAVFVTESARAYLQKRGVKLVVCAEADEKKDSFVDAVTGKRRDEKPEYMTHLRGNVLVSKTHPRIALRGCLDMLQAEVLVLCSRSRAAGSPVLADDLEDVLRCTRAILAAEVKDEPLAELSLLGLDAAGLRYHSHHVGELIGGGSQPLPDASMSDTALSLNRLRTLVRAAELKAVEAFERRDGGSERNDIVLALNRLSSAVHIMFCREIGGKYRGA